jgi:hypothetical protein
MKINLLPPAVVATAVIIVLHVLHTVHWSWWTVAIPIPSAYAIAIFYGLTVGNLTLHWFGHTWRYRG